MSGRLDCARMSGANVIATCRRGKPRSVDFGAFVVMVAVRVDCLLIVHGEVNADLILARPDFMVAGGLPGVAIVVSHCFGPSPNMKKPKRLEPPTRTASPIIPCMASIGNKAPKPKEHSVITATRQEEGSRGGIFFAALPLLVNSLLAFGWAVSASAV